MRLGCLHEALMCTIMLQVNRNNNMKTEELSFPRVNDGTSYPDR